MRAADGCVWLSPRDQAIVNALSICVALGRASQSNVLYDELTQMVVKALTAMGCHAFREWELTPRVLAADVVLLFGAGAQFNEYPALLAQLPQRRPVTILWLIEPVPPAAISRRLENAALRLQKINERWPVLGTASACVLQLLASGSPLSGIPSQFLFRRYSWLKERIPEGWLAHTFASTRAKADFLVSRQIPATFCPVGYHPDMGRDLGGERDIDVLFIGGAGAQHPRRRRMLEDLQRSLASAGVRFVQRDGACFGRERMELINRARIFLNIAKYSWDLSIERFLLGMASGALVVSEPLGDAAPFVPGGHFVEAPIPEMSERILFYLRQPDERERIVRSARRLITENLTLENSLRSMLAHAMSPGQTAAE